MGQLIEVLKASLDGVPDRIPPPSDDVAVIAAQHHLLPLVADAWFVAEPARPSMSDDVRQAAETNARRALDQVVDILALVTLLEGDGGIPALFVKGVPLSARSYGNPLLRHVGDIDLLVHPEDVAEVAARLDRAGYHLHLQYTRRGEPSTERFLRLTDDLRAGKVGQRERGGSDLDWATFLRLGNEFSFVHPQGGVIDLHWRLFRNPWFLPLDPWRRTASLRLGPASIQVLDPVVELVYLIAHGSEHGWSSLKWLVDLAYVLDHGGASLDDVAEVARSAGLERAVASALRITARLFARPNPAALETVFPASHREHKEAISFIDDLLHDRIHGPGEHEKARELLTLLRLRTGTRFRLRAVEDKLVPANWWIDMAAGPLLRVPRVVRSVAHTARANRSAA